MNLNSRKILRERQVRVYISFLEKFGDHINKCTPFSFFAPAVADAKAHQSAAE